MYRAMKYLLEHPIKACTIFFGGLALLIIVAVQLPEWGLILFECSLVLAMIVMFLRQSYRTKKEKQKMDNLTPDDFKKMYAEYEALVEEQIRIQSYDSKLIYKKWLEYYHELFYVASSMLDRTKFTDFHLAACMIFALVYSSDSLNHVRFVYDCVRSLISKPRVYLRHVDYGGMITLEVKETWQEVNLCTLEEAISVDDICKIIKEMYISNKNKYTLIELADFLKRLYLRCR